jgi:hypothetical protein
MRLSKLKWIESIGLPISMDCWLFKKAAEKCMHIRMNDEERERLHG